MANDQEKQQEQQEQNQNNEERHKFITDVGDRLDPERKKQREAEEEEARQRAKKRKLIPPFVMLLAGAIVSITLRKMHYELQDMLLILLCVLLVFLFIGELIKYMMDQFEIQIEKARKDEGEVIEKELEEEDDIQNTRRRTSVREADDESEAEDTETV